MLSPEDATTPREAPLMTPLRKRMIEDMKIRDYSDHTISAYVSAVYRLAAFYRKSPDKLGREEIRTFLVDLVEDKKVSWPYYRQVLAALRFLYRHVLRRGEVVEDVRGPRPEKKLPIVLYGNEFWDRVVDFDALIEFGTISPEDVDLFHRADTVDDAFDFVTCRLLEDAMGKPGICL